tara:strand:- start:475 stop:1623 length:1149 start_codon:yes stop_codon:yes gene_type:complete
MPVPAILYYGGLGALRLAPTVMRLGGAGLRAIGGGIKSGLKPSNIKSYFTGTRARPIQGPVNVRNFKFNPNFKGREALGMGGGSAPGIVRPGRFGSNYLTQAGLGYGAYDLLTNNAEQSASDGQITQPNPATPGGPAGMTIEEGKKAGIIKDKKEKPSDDKTTSTDDQIKKGDLDSFINDRIGLFEKYLGDDSRKRTKSAAYNAMVQFGLNLASSKDPKLLSAIAESAKDPMKEFAALGNKLMDRAESIKKAGIESGVAAYDKAQDREVDREAIAADILKEQIKQQAKTLSRGEFITATMESIAGNQTLVDAITSVKYDKDGNLIENAPSDAALIQKYAEEQYDIYRAVEIPPGSAGDELYESLPSGSRYYDQQTGTYGTKP